MKRLFSEETLPAAGRWKSPVTLLVSQCLPVLDFDQKPRAIITEPHRLYKTDNGWHILLIGRVGMPDGLFFENMQKIGVDRGYLSSVQRTGLFRIRVSPKDFFPIQPRQSVAQFMGQLGSALPEWNAFILRHDALCQSHEPNPVLV